MRGSLVLLPAGCDVNYKVSSEFLDQIISYALSEAASDLYIEPRGDGFFVKIRRNGIVEDYESVPQEISKSIFSRLKALANLDVTESRKPQDGSFAYQVEGSKYHFRLSTSCTKCGETAVLRLFNEDLFNFSLDSLQVHDDIYQKLISIIKKRSGLFLSVGPTGSGKTTTLYSILNKLDLVSNKAITVEDPVEKQFENLLQMTVNHEIGLTFGRGLRSGLRHDPDIILVGEIRDEETAKIAFQAALTGHAVFASLHAYDTLSCIPRLMNLGVEKSLIASTLNGVLAQRMIRLNEDEESQKRRAIFELLEVDQPIKNALLAEGFSLAKLKLIEKAKGSLTLLDRANGLLKQNLTTKSEIARVLDS